MDFIIIFVPRLYRIKNCCIFAEFLNTEYI
jgi:hypothetical protein